MKPPLLVVDSNIEFSEREQAAWAKREIASIRVDTMRKAIELLKKLQVLFTVINGDNVDYLLHLKQMREMASTLIFIGTTNFRVEDQIIANNNGAHFYGAFQESPERNVDSALAIYQGITGFTLQRDEIPSALSIHDMLINPANREVICNSVLVPLTKKEFDILYYIASNQNQILTYQMICNEVWSNSCDAASNAAVHQHIYSIRNKFIRATGHDGYIENIVGSGYRILATKENCVE